MRLVLFLFLFISSFTLAQVTPKPAQRDPYLQNPVKNQPQKSKPGEKVHIKNADEISKDTK